MASKNPSFDIFISVLLSLLAAVSSRNSNQSELSVFMWRGEWTLLQQSIGISAMHMQLLHDNTVVMFDRTDFGPSNLTLPFGRCRIDPLDTVLKRDCTAHSVLYDVVSNSFHPLTVQTDTFCSSGSLDPDGTLVQTGGYNDGEKAVRTFSPCIGLLPFCDWTELPNHLLSRRWYASNQILPDGRFIILGGRNAFSYEFLPRRTNSTHYIKFLRETYDWKEENNLYPFLHLLPDGSLFIFANTRSISFDYARNRIIKVFPSIPGGHKRNYPSSGSSVLLPLDLSGLSDPARLPAAEVMVCGGAPPGSFPKANLGVYQAASRTCGRLRVSDPEPEWKMELMPFPRVLLDTLLLPTGEVIIINGASNGTGGWENAVNPVYNPVLYRTYQPDPRRKFVVLAATSIPRMYHSAAVLLGDGRVLVGGSNPHRTYLFSGVRYQTELSLEAFSPPYLSPRVAQFRPSILSVETNGDVLIYEQLFAVTFTLMAYRGEQFVAVTMVAPSFSTHSCAMNQRLLKLNLVRVDRLSEFGYKVTARAPASATIAPPGYYMLFVVNAGVPSLAAWVKMRSSDYVEFKSWG